MATVSTHAINPGLYKNMPYDPVKDFAPVGGRRQDTGDRRRHGNPCAGDAGAADATGAGRERLGVLHLERHPRPREDAGVDPTPGATPEKLGEFIKSELAKWTKLIKDAGIKAD